MGEYRWKKANESNHQYTNKYKMSLSTNMLVILNRIFITEKVHFQREKDLFVEAIVDQLQRELMEKSILHSAFALWKKDKTTAKRIIELQSI